MKMHIQAFGGAVGEALPPSWCLLALRAGTVAIDLDSRRLLLDEDVCLILDGARAAASRCAHSAPPLGLCAVFDREAVGEALGAAGLGPGFLEHLRARDAGLGARLALVEGALDTRSTDAGWLGSQAALLLADAVEAERVLLARGERIASVKPATRRELLRRVLLAADFMLGHYEQPIRLEHVADAARLSRFHLVRLFHRVQGRTPHDFLLAKRLSVARRLLGQTRCDLAEIALRSGFGTRCSLFRHLHKRLGASGRELRAWPLAPEDRGSARPCRIAA